ncbi:hypothetical protein RFY98_03855, partial [Acinetobacter baumannii]|nr:hypothetical protein [Acinetobacter baumannii]
LKYRDCGELPQLEKYMDCIEIVQPLKYKDSGKTPEALRYTGCVEIAQANKKRSIRTFLTP